MTILDSGLLYSGRDVTSLEDGVVGADALVDCVGRDWVPGDLLTPDGSGQDAEVRDDGFAEVHADVDVVEPVKTYWDPCDQANPCTNPEQPLCLLTQGDKGICTRTCNMADPVCGPWGACVSPDPLNKPDEGYCLRVAGELEPCDPEAGLYCPRDRSCLPVGDGGQRLCTALCLPGETICPELTRCSLEGPDPGEYPGVCLLSSRAELCSVTKDCPVGMRCGGEGPWDGLCLKECQTQTCGGFETCIPKAPGGLDGVCVHLSQVGHRCAPQRGWFCNDPAVCVQTSEQGFGWCVMPCQEDGDCATQEICGTGFSPDGPRGCLRPDMSGSAAEPCDQVNPCPDGLACGDVGTYPGRCLPACGECPEGSVCRDGACLRIMSQGGGCAPEWGWICAEGLDCVREPWSSSGICLAPCQDSCPEGALCTPAGGSSYCLTELVSFGSPCSLSQGLVCDPQQGLECLFMLQGNTGFCSHTCPVMGQGGCPAAPPGTMAECMINSQDSLWCGFLCMGTSCPEGMTCNTGFCSP